MFCSINSLKRSRVVGRKFWETRALGRRFRDVSFETRKRLIPKDMVACLVFVLFLKDSGHRPLWESASLLETDEHFMVKTQTQVINNGCLMDKDLVLGRGVFESWRNETKTLLVRKPFHSALVLLVVLHVQKAANTTRKSFMIHAALRKDGSAFQQAP